MNFLISKWSVYNYVQCSLCLPCTFCKLITPSPSKSNLMFQTHGTLTDRKMRGKKVQMHCTNDYKNHSLVLHWPRYPREGRLALTSFNTSQTNHISLIEHYDLSDSIHLRHITGLSMVVSVTCDPGWRKCCKI